MFLSKEAISKQLFYEFLQFKTLGLPPGKSVELAPGTLLGNALKEDLGLSIEFAERQLSTQLKIKNVAPAEQEEFNRLFSFLIAYKKSTYIASNPFAGYAQMEAGVAHPCAWLVFAPLLIQSNKENLAYETKEDFINYLKNPKVGFHFDKNCTVNKTGLYIAVQSNNHQMVNAFLCPEFYNYHLTKEDLKILLSLTKDPQTRVALFRSCSEELISWINEDKELQINCIISFDELVELWSFLNTEQRSEFIKNTNAQLWLRLLDKDLGRHKIIKLLDAEYPQLNLKLLKDVSIKKAEFIPQTLNYLIREQQFNYLLNATELDKLFPIPHNAQWHQLLSALGYQINEGGSVTVTRYVLRGPVAKTHNQLINVLISLPVRSSVIIEALQKIENYVHEPTTKEEYRNFLNRIAKDVVRKEYETGFFLINWFNQLLRYLHLKNESPLHPYIDKLANIIKEEAVDYIPGELMDILPIKTNYSVYKESLSAYFDANMAQFWLNLSEEDREKIIHTPILFERLLHFLSAPIDHRSEFLKSLDKKSLEYFNTHQGLKQLISDTPSFTSNSDLPLLIEAMQLHDLIFLEDSERVVKILVEPDDKIFKQVSPFFPSKADTLDCLLFQESVLEELPRPLEKEQFNRFLQAYCDDAHHFSALLLKINNSNPLLVSQCWDNVSPEMWIQWYGELEHAQLWSQVLKHLEISDRLEFFEKLTSEGKLTADELCDFLLSKNEAVFNTLWNKVPMPQWSTWLIDNPNLPETSLSFLNTMAYPLRVQFFKSMLKMSPDELASICVVPNKTIEQFFPQEVQEKVSSANTVSDAKAKLNKLKEIKFQEFDDHFVSLAKSIDSLNKHLTELRTIDIKSHNHWGVWGASFFTTDSYYGLINSIKISRSLTDKLTKNISSHSLLAMKKEQIETKPKFQKLGEMVQELNQHIIHLALQKEEMPNNILTEFTGLQSTINAISEGISISLVDVDLNTEYSMKRPV